MTTEPELVYHIYHHRLLALAKPFERVSLSVPLVSDESRTERKSVQSLLNDMTELRRIGAEKGIVDPSELSVGSSTQGRQLLALKVGKGDKHKVLITGGHHANEWSSVEIPYLIAKYLIESYVEEPSADDSADDATVAGRKRIKHLLDNRQIWFVPMVNPDGHYRAMTRDRTWRKNCKTHRTPGGFPIQITPPPADGAIHVLEAIDGVDLNRNYPTLTWQQTPITAAYVDGELVTDTETWSGPSRACERETQAMARLIRDHRFQASISYHNFGVEVLYFHYDAYLLHVAKGVTALLNEGAHEGPYKLKDRNKPHRATGHIADYCYEYAPGQPTLGLELPPHYLCKERYGYSWVGEDTLGPTFRENLPAALALINSAGFSKPPGEVRVCVKDGTQVVQVVGHDWEVFKDWPVGERPPEG